LAGEVKRNSRHQCRQGQKQQAHFQPIRICRVHAADSFLPGQLLLAPTKPATDSVQHEAITIMARGKRASSGRFGAGVSYRRDEPEESPDTASGYYANRLGTIEQPT
jgi:hypothetical protein